MPKVYHYTLTLLRVKLPQIEEVVMNKVILLSYYIQNHLLLEKPEVQTQRTQGS